MSTAPLTEVAAAIARLGRENNNLREVNSRGGMADELQRANREQQQEIEALRQIDEQLQAAIERERSLRKAAEAGRDEWIERLRSESAAARLLQEHLGVEHRKVAELNGEVQRLTTNLADAGRATEEAIGNLHAQLQAAESAVEEAIESRTRAEEAYADCGRRNGELQGQLLAATAAAKLHASVAQKHLDMLRTAREALHEVVGEFVNADTEEIEAADLSTEQAALIVAKVRRALAATA
jgi:chromosome segregation ATPase